MKIIKFQSQLLGGVALALILSGCAFMPDLGDMLTPRSDLVAAPRAVSDDLLPQTQWWKQYGDSQLNGLIEEGLRQSPSLAEAAARVRSADAAAEKAGAPLLPSLNGDASYSRARQSYNMGIDPGFFPHGYKDQTSAQLSLAYEIDFWGKNSAALSAAVSQADAARLQSDQAELVLTTSIAATYADLAQAYAELNNAESSVDVRRQTVNLFRQRFSKGLENESGVAEARTNLANAEAEVETIKETIALEKNKLAALIGWTAARAGDIQRPGSDKIVAGKLPDLLPADLLGRRPDVQALRLQMQAAADKIHVARAGFYPSVNLSALIGLESLSLETFTHSNSLMAGVGPAIHLPLFEGGKLEGEYREARGDYDTAVAQYNGAIINALHEVADALTSQRALDKRTAKTREALDAAEHAFKVVSDRYKSGLATYLEVLSSEDALLQTRRSMADIRARAFVVDVALIKALGGGFQMPVNDKDNKGAQ